MIYQHMDMEVDRELKEGATKPAHGTIRSGEREHTACSNMKKKTKDAQAKHQLLKIVALPGTFLYLPAVLHLIIANIHTQLRATANRVGRGRLACLEDRYAMLW